MEMIPIIGITDDIRCVHCGRIDGKLWDGPVPCCEPEPFLFEDEEDFWTWTWTNPESILSWTRSGVGEHRFATRARARIARTREGCD